MLVYKAVSANYILMDDQNSLKTERRTLCEVLGTDPICNGSCKLHSYFSDRMDFYTKSLLHLQAGPPKEVLICYANPFFSSCAVKFSQDLDIKMSQYLEQFNPRIELTSQRSYPGISPFDFSRSLGEGDFDKSSLTFQAREIERNEPQDPLSDSLKKYIQSRIRERVQDSPLRFLVYSAPEDAHLAQKVIQTVLRSMSDELISLTLVKPPVRVEHGMPLQFQDFYTIDLDYIIHHAMNLK